VSLYFRLYLSHVLEDFYNFISMETGMNTPQLHVIYFLDRERLNFALPLKPISVTPVPRSAIYRRSRFAPAPVNFLHPLTAQLPFIQFSARSARFQIRSL